jgi:diguanylate cyclase (GGDEF)-like protein
MARVSELNRRVTVLESQAVTDDLTGVLRRGAGLAALERDLAAVKRSASGRLAVVFIDLDGLKEVNDQLGHVEGDRLLRKVATALESGLRAQDLVFRYGGDEFVCILPESNAGAAWNKVREIRDGLAAEMARTPFTHGAAEFRAGDTSRDLLARADADLYQRRAQPQSP